MNKTSISCTTVDEKWYEYATCVFLEWSTDDDPPAAADPDHVAKVGQPAEPPEIMKKA